MSYVAKVNTHLGGHPLKAGEAIPAHVIDKAGHKNLEDLLAAGFIVEEGASDAAGESESVVSEECVEEKPKKKKVK